MASNLMFKSKLQILIYPFLSDAKKLTSRNSWGFTLNPTHKNLHQLGINEPYKLYICRNMGYAKERGKFEKLTTKVSGLKNYDDKSLTIITDIFEQYSHSVRILKNKNPEDFTKLYQTDLEQVKLAKLALKTGEEADREDNFIKYRDSLLAALNSAITATKETL